MDRQRPTFAPAVWLAIGALLVVAIVYFAFVRPRASNTEPSPSPQGRPAALPREKPAPPKPATGPELYATHCAACHGDKGDGNGLAARFLYPRPRDFSEALFRLVSTDSNVPSDQDLEHVIRAGMPGSAMLAFGHLSDSDIRLLVAEVRQRIRDGVTERIKRELAESGDELSAEDLAKRVAMTTRPGDPVAIPAKLPEANPASIARGAALYKDVKLGCVSCHGETGKGDGVQEQKNTDGTPTRPRDFTRGVFKGGREPRRLFARILRGMPGTPMPSSALPPQQIGDLANYILSLSPAEATEKVTFRRQAVTAKKVEALPDGPSAAGWKIAGEVPIVVAPLWWRETDADLRVAAVHDGKTLALRLSWRDVGPSRLAGRTDDFEDMAAVQLFKGGREPFVGMGGADGAIDLWLWRAGRDKDTNGELDDYPFATPAYKGLVKGKGVPDFLTARAAGNPNVTRSDRVAGHLTARGFGSTTFRPRQSQLVAASAEWKAGRWAVVLRRPLAVAAAEGVALAAGDSCSIAFAVWFGEAKDRNGQKLVSVWHDLKIE